MKSLGTLVPTIKVPRVFLVGWNVTLKTLLMMMIKEEISIAALVGNKKKAISCTDYLNELVLPHKECVNAFCQVGADRKLRFVLQLPGHRILTRLFLQ